MKRGLSLIWTILWRVGAGIISCFCLVIVILDLPDIMNFKSSQLRHWIVFIPALMGAVMLPLLIMSGRKNKKTQI